MRQVVEGAQGGTTMIRIGLGVVLGALSLACAPTIKYLEPVGDVSFPVKGSSELNAKLYRPQGEGPFPAVVLMHNCSGLGAGSTGLENVALLLRDSGYVALAVNSFSWPWRRVFNTCDDPSTPPTSLERLEDAFAARRYLSSLAFVDTSRIGLVGWGHGGVTALMIWSQDPRVAAQVGRQNLAPFAAVAAYYPYCLDLDVRSASAPLLILIGEDDDFCPATLCMSLVPHATKLGRDASITIYPGATAAFDSLEGGERVDFQGHHLAPDPAAGKDSRERLLAFFGRTLKKP
jgi:dienelactone hydrolase